MNQTYGQESETERIRRTESNKSVRVDAYGCENAERVSEGTGSQRLAPDRKNRTEGIGVANAVGGILHQLIEDARKQLAKSRECIIWYQSEAREYEEKLKNLTQLMELQELQQQQEADDENRVNLE